MSDLFKQRLASIDGFRAITMMWMLFVNDIPGLRNIPHWLLHAEVNEDMLGFSDTIFPAFLFAMGLSIPLAIGKRLERGDSLLKTSFHILERTVALIVMGLFTVNLDSFDSEACMLSHQWFAILMVVGFFLIWDLYPKSEGWKKYLFISMRLLGVALLVFLFCIYKGHDGQAFGPKWWGILGLLGWTYLVCAVTYLITRHKLMYMSIAWLLFVTLAVLTHAGVFYISFIPSDMTLHAFGVSGMLTAILMSHFIVNNRPKYLLGTLFGLGIIMLIAFFVSHPHWIISKIQATPTWLFICNAIFFPLFGCLYWLMDMKKITKWFSVIAPAGKATLTCYILPYLWYNVQWLMGWWYPSFLGEGVPGLIKSLIFSLLIIQLARLLMKYKITLKI